MALEGEIQMLKDVGMIYDIKRAIQQYLYSARFCHNSPKVLLNNSVVVEVVEASIEVEPLFGARIPLPLCDSIVVVQVVVQVSIDVRVQPGGHGYISNSVDSMYGWHQHIH